MYQQFIWLEHYIHHLVERKSENMFFKRFVVGRLGANCYLVACEKTKKAVDEA